MAIRVGPSRVTWPDPDDGRHAGDPEPMPATLGGSAAGRASGRGDGHGRRGEGIEDGGERGRDGLLGEGVHAEREGGVDRPRGAAAAASRGRRRAARSAARTRARTTAASPTRTNATTHGPSAGAATRMYRNEAPNMAPRKDRRRNWREVIRARLGSPEPPTMDSRASRGHGRMTRVGARCRTHENARRNRRSLDGPANVNTGEITRCSRPLRARPTIGDAG